MPQPLMPTWDELLTDATIPEIDRLLNKAMVVDKLFSGAAVLATVRGMPFHRGTYGQMQMPPPLRKMPFRPLFDLGDLTRVLATHVGVLHQAGRHRLDTNITVGSVLKDFSATGVGAATLDMILDHTSGLPADAVLYESVENADKKVAKKEKRLGTPKAIAEIRANATKVPLAAKPGTVTCVSNLGFLVLGWVLEEVTKKPLNVFLREEVYKPLECQDILTFSPLPLGVKSPRRSYLSTEQCAWRNKLLTGEVADRNAWAMGGVAGHAGLFGTADAVWRLAQTMLDTAIGKSRVFHAPTLQRLWTRSKRVADTSRTFGWDTAGRDNHMLNIRFGHGSVGEISSVGNAVWIDPVQNIVAVFLVNANHPTYEGKAEALAKLRLRCFELIASYAPAAAPEKAPPSPKVAALLERLKKRKFKE